VACPWRRPACSCRARRRRAPAYHRCRWRLGLTGRRDRNRRHHAADRGVLDALLDAASNSRRSARAISAVLRAADELGLGRQQWRQQVRGIYSGGAAFDFGGGGGMVIPEMSTFGG
jgi:hypothetical protein